MSRLTLAAWIIVGLCVLGAVGVAVARPMHWERTVAVAVIVAIIAAGTAIAQTRRRSSR